VRSVPAGELKSGAPEGVEVQVLGHLIYYLPPVSREETKAVATVPVGTALGCLPGLLDIPHFEIQSYVVNGQAVTDLSRVLGRGDTVVLLPVISSG
jgi:molybdopterin converting factor small subunit